MPSSRSDERLNRVCAVINGKGGVGKCPAAYETVVDVQTGLPMTIADAVAARLPRVTSYAADGDRLGAFHVAAHVDSGVRPVVRVELASGRSLTVTPHHPMLLPGEWRRAEDVEPGETVASTSWTAPPLAPQRLPEGELDLLAVMLAEGGTSTPATNFSTTDPAVLALATTAATSFGARLTAADRKDLTWTVVGAAPSLRLKPGHCRCGCGAATDEPLHGGGSAARKERQFLYRHGPHPRNRLSDFRQDHGLDFVLSKNKTMPSAVYRLPQDQLARFLAVFWMCDGYVSQSGTPELALASQPLVRALQHLLLRFGIQSRVAYKRSTHGERKFDSWRLSVYASSIPSFDDHIDLWGTKGQRLKRRADVLRVTGGNTNVGAPSLTPDLWKRIRAYAPPCGRPAAGARRLRDVADRLGWSFAAKVPLRELLTNQSSNGRRYLSQRALAAYLEVLGGEDGVAELGHLTSKHLHWDRVVRVVPAGTAAVYDLSVPGPANFVCSDLVVHNTSITANVAGQVADAGYRTLAVDLDLSGNLKLDLGYVGHGKDDDGEGLVDAVWKGEPLPVIPGVRDGLDVVPGGRHLEMLAALSLTPMAQDLTGGGVAAAFATKLAELAEAQDYGLVLLDCAPGNPVLQDMALAAARYVLIPTKTDPAGWDGLRMVGPRVRKAREHNPDLTYLGVVLFAHQSTATRVLQATRNQLEEVGDTLPLLETAVRHSEAAAHDCRSRGQLAHELARDVDTNAAARLKALRSRRRRTGNVIELPPALSAAADSLAGDYRHLAHEVLTRIAAAEQGSTTAGRRK